jgi:hypothetical protein
MKMTLDEAVVAVRVARADQDWQALLDLLPTLEEYQLLELEGYLGSEGRSLLEGLALAQSRKWLEVGEWLASLPPSLARATHASWASRAKADLTALEAETKSAVWYSRSGPCLWEMRHPKGQFEILVGDSASLAVFPSYWQALTVSHEDLWVRAWKGYWGGEDPGYGDSCIAVWDPSLQTWSGWYGLGYMSPPLASRF